MPDSLPQEGPIASNAAISSERTDDAGRSRVGKTIKGKWRLDAVLGAGGTATVYAATHRNGNRVAVKVLHRRFSGMPAERKRFAREGYFANKVDHPDVVRVLDEDVDDEGNPFLVMELLDGEPLVARWKEAGFRLPVPEALWIVDRLLGVLEAAHARGIVHRDVKPDNLFLTAGGGLKVLDFGIARLRGVGSGTMRGVVLGTPGFTAPEQARGEWEIVGARTDIWAVGATLFALLTGRLVHEDQQTAAHLLRVSMEPAPPVHQIAPDVPDSVARVIDRALSFTPQLRFESAAEMRQAVGAAYRLTTGEPLRGTRPNGVVNNAGYAPTLRVTTGTTGSTVVTRRSKVSARPSPPGRWNAAAKATAFFALGGIVVGYVASAVHHRTDVSTAATLVAPALPSTVTTASDENIAYAPGASGETPGARAALNQVVGEGTTRGTDPGSRSLLSARASGEPAPAGLAPTGVAPIAVESLPAENAGMKPPASAEAPPMARVAPLPTMGLPGTAGPRRVVRPPPAVEKFDFVESRR
jgi:serine/threonine-protein kinase